MVKRAGESKEAKKGANLVNAEFRKPVPLGCSVEWNISRPEEHVVVVSIFPVLQDSAGAAVGFDDIVGKDTELLELGAVVELGEEGDGVFLLACELFFIERCNITERDVSGNKAVMGDEIRT